MDNRVEILNLQEAATFLRLKPRTLCGLAVRGAVPAAKVGNQWRFRRPALEALFDPTKPQDGPAAPA